MAPTIVPVDGDDARSLARRLLDAAGPDRKYEIRTVSAGVLGIAFDVPDDVAAAVTGVQVGESMPPQPAVTALPSDEGPVPSASAVDEAGKEPVEAGESGEPAARPGRRRRTPEPGVGG
jgi:hypothetical protein